MELIVRYNYGAITPWATAMGDGLVFVSGLVVTASDSIAPSVNQPEPIDISLVLRSGKDRSLFFARVVSVEFNAPLPIDSLATRNDTLHYWPDWVGRCTHVGEWRYLVVRSLITLKALTYESAGAICEVRRPR